MNERAKRGRRCGVAVILCLGISGGFAGAQVQPAPSQPVFDVITIKPNKSEAPMMMFNWNNGFFRATNIPLTFVFLNAFDTREDLISGLPAWAKSARWDMEAKAVDADPAVLKAMTDAQQQAMLRTLLEERFALKTHVETKELPVYNLVPVKGGAKLKVLPFKDGTPECKGNMNTGPAMMTGECIPLASLTYFLASNQERSVIDKTGLPVDGRFDIKLRFQSSRTGPNDGLSDTALPSLFIALQEQLGLKLEPAKGPVEILVIDHLEKPTED